MTKVLEVSNSRLRLWRKCRYAHYLRYVEKLEKKAPAVQLVRGKVIHSMIEARINKQSWAPIMKEFRKEYNKLFKEEKDEYGDLPGEVERLMNGYIKAYEDEDLTYIKKGGKRAEFEFSVPLFQDINLIGLIDTIPRDSKDRVWIMEHKTHKVMPSESARFTDIQTVIYTWVAPQMGFPKPTGVLWDYLRTKAPTIPKLLANGKGLSQAKDIDTTYDVYMDEIIKHGFDPADYAETLERLNRRSEAFYKRVYMPAPNTILKPLIQDVADTAREIQMLGEYSKTRNITKDCSWCSYYAICQAELRGLDSEFIRKAEYAPRKGREDGKEKQQESSGDQV